MPQSAQNLKPKQDYSLFSSLKIFDEVNTLPILVCEK